MVGLVGGALLIGCGDDTTSTGGSGTGGNTGAGNVGGNPTTGGNGTGGNGGTAPTDCTEITLSDFRIGSATVAPALGAAAPDNHGTILTPGQTGMGMFAVPANVQECGDTAVCAVVVEDNDAMAMTVGRYYLAQSGTINLTANDDAGHATGSLSNVTYVEITFDDMTGDVTTVPNGACLHLASVDFDIAGPTDAWTCDPSYFNALDGCDCNCGVIDPDCEVPDATVFGCQEGQTCDNATATCAGLPTGWTCAPDQFNGGAGNGCDCACGAADPDCDLMGEVVDGCQAGDSCNAGVCLPAAWACNPSYYDSGLMDDCDCGCGAVDPDCADATKASCNYCDDSGSCSMVACDDPMSTINMTNNAVCM